VTADADPIAVALRVTHVLDSLGIVSSIGGSIASSVAGEPRSTIDVDIVAAIEEAHIPALVAALNDEFYVDEDALRRAVRIRRSTNLIHQASQFKIDIFPAGGTPLDSQLLVRRRAIEMDGRTIHVHSPEDILLQKLRWFRLGGESSDQQWRDVLGIVRVQADRLDQAYLRIHAPTLDVTDLVDRILGHDQAS
jgi:hypothetical protein